MERELNVNLTRRIRAFYIIHNEMSLFSGSLSIYGLRRNYDRTGYNVWQPFDILVTNTFESPDDKVNRVLLVTTGKMAPGCMQIVQTEEFIGQAGSLQDR